MSLLNNPETYLVNLLTTLPGLLIAITFHELAHGIMAYKLGDPTAKSAGRLTLNPISHIDIVGFILLFIVHFGWAKPVPINPLYFKNRKLGMILVSIAGPLTNFVIAIIAAFVLVSGIISTKIIFNMVIVLLQYNIILGVFNLLPFPPLDGSKIIASLLPVKYEILFYRYEKYLYLILIFLMLTNGTDRLLGPLIDLGYDFLIRIMSIAF